MIGNILSVCCWYSSCVELLTKKIATGTIPQYEFIKTTKSKAAAKNSINLGILVTHNSMTFWMDNWNKEKTIVYYSCSKKKSHGCQATAIVNQITRVFDEVNQIKEERFTEFGSSEIWDDVISALEKEVSRLSWLRRVKTKVIGQVPKEKMNLTQNHF